MGNITKRGTNDPLVQSTELVFDPQCGVRQITSLKGISQSQMAALQAEYQAGGVPCTFKQNQGGTYSLDVDDPSQLYLIDTWQVVGNSEEIEALSHPLILLNPDFSDSVRDHMRKNLSESVPVETVFDATNGDIILKDFAGVELALLQRWYSLMNRGAVAYKRGQYVLRHTSNAPPGWSHNVSDIGVEQIYSTANLLSEVTDPYLWAYPLPQRLITKLSDITSSPPIIPMGLTYFFGWLKQPSTETTGAHFRIDITTEYILELWSNDFYSIY